VEFKNTGDGLCVAFSSASAAIACAVQIQQRFERRYRRAEQRLHVRIGLSAGESTVSEGDYFGMPTVEAARLCDRAGPDEILISPAVRMLAGRVSNAELKSVGELELKGLPEPMEAFSVPWRPLEPEAGPGFGGMPLPSTLRSVPSVAYVGRAEERALIELASEAARQGDRQIVLLSGEPGIGKTRLASYSALSAHGEGFAVSWGACSEEVVAPFEPWIAACTHLAQHAPEEALRAHVQRHGGELTRLTRAVQSRLPDTPAPQTSDPETERYLLFSAVADFLDELARAVPVCLVLDDFHWADSQSIALLKHAVRTVEQSRLLVLVTYRDSDLTRGHPLSATLADLRRIDGAQRIALRGLAPDEVAQVMSAAAGHDLDEDGTALATDVAAETGGNPFFVAELLRHLLESGVVVFDERSSRWRVDRSRGVGLPDSLRDVIEQRVDRLGTRARETLSTAAVIGRSFEVELLGRLMGGSETALLDLLEAAVAASLLHESTEEIGRFEFAHALINEALYETLGRTRRARLHHQVALALEELYGNDPGERVADLALHWRLATVAVDRGKASEYARRAGEQALERLAPSEAARWFGDALELLDDGDSVEHCEALIGLGEAQRQNGDGAFRQTLLDAAGLAVRLGHPELQARAVLANTRGWVASVGAVDDGRVRALEAALDALPARGPQRPLLLVQLAIEISFANDFERVQALCDEAIATARSADDTTLLARVLIGASAAFFLVRLPDTLAHRLELTREAITLAERTGDPQLQARAWMWRREAGFQAGDLEMIEQALERTCHFADRAGDITARWTTIIAACDRAMLAGDLAGAEAKAIEAATFGTQNAEPDAALVAGLQIFMIRQEQRRLSEIAALVAARARETPGLPSLQMAVACCELEAGNLDAARATLKRFAEHDFADFPHDAGWLAAMSRCTDIAAACQERVAARKLYELLLPYRSQFGYSGYTIFCSVERMLGRLALLVGDLDLADRHLAAAEAVHERLGARLQLAWTRIDQAKVLIARRSDGDRARELLEHARNQADEVGGELARRAAEELLCASFAEPAPARS
jgi:hypothetical protein